MPKQGIIYLIYPVRSADMPKERGYGVVRDLCGHGIGTALHEAPEIPNYEVGRKGVKLRARYDTCHRADDQYRNLRS